MSSGTFSELQYVALCYLGVANGGTAFCKESVLDIIRVVLC